MKIFHMGNLYKCFPDFGFGNNVEYDDGDNMIFSFSLFFSSKSITFDK